MIFVTALLTGLLGSFHCVGMCGPIAMSTPTVGFSLLDRVTGKLIYNFGRIITYSLMGIVLGAFGFGLKLAGLQQSISIIAGVIIILGVLFNHQSLHRFIGNPFSLFSGKLAGKLFQHKTYLSLLLIGLLNGLLPCGFVYIGLIGAVATQDLWNGGLFMFFFGLGTLPLMFFVSMLGQFISIQTRSKINRFTPLLALLVGCLFILRGLNLGLPYLSPKIGSDQNKVEECCKPNQTHDAHYSPVNR